MILAIILFLFYSHVHLKSYRDREMNMYFGYDSIDGKNTLSRPPLDL